eukprot:CAMPEP_0117796528 /NCGR_PEP_ID=MMETSP0948-20121206/11968_1 /TAXON_ID=44440 /ORGANISM="Chattonella subsalsa, Strain CCMP2191" /LENGTH=283 /DNA_ID=CAMNT_0005627713 /DNA_START=29 /DNA_END=880 /DNA_ORIENTATION=-
MANLIRCNALNYRLFERMPAFATKNALLSSNAASPKKGDSQFVKERRIYKKQVSELRKQYREEFLKKRAEEEAKKKEERARVLAEKRVRKAKRASKALRSIARVEEERQEQAARFKAYQAEMDIVRQARMDKTKLAVENMMKEVESEADTWITPENIDEKITEDLFRKKGTSGLWAPSSYYMRYAADIDWGEEHAHEGEEEQEDILEKLMDHFDQEAVIRNQLARELGQDFSSTAQDITDQEKYIGELAEVLKDIEIHYEDKQGGMTVMNENKDGNLEDEDDL